MRSLPVITTASCLLLFASSVFAQSDRGTITGTVSDTSGAVVAGAQIQAKQLVVCVRQNADYRGHAVHA
jgi:hypothetical protein